ncbi:MAG: tRNA (adenosine(37)-N6)-threonylcarbamoyltransferase complex dimerization subunit type 1 TsaB [Acidimicrobiales bacterium]
MNVLAIETATEVIGCALWASGRPLGWSSLVAGRRHAETLMPAIDDLCRRAGLRATDIEGVAVDVGPGLFTGLRVGLSTARALASALGTPVAGVNSLEALAHPQRFCASLVAPVVDAKRSEVFWAVYRFDGLGGVEQLRAPAVAGPEDVGRQLASLDEPVLLVGDGAWRYRDVLASPKATCAGAANAWPSVLAVAELGEARLESAGTTAADFPRPLYLRQADVRIGWEQMSGAGPGGLGQ